MDIAGAILVIGLAALVAAFLLLLIGLVYSELMNSEVPAAVANGGKLHLLHGVFVGAAVTGRILQRLGICQQVSFVRWLLSCLRRRSGRPTPGLRVKDLSFGGVPVRVYEPTAASHHLRRGLVYLHGGGWVLGCIDSVDGVCRRIAKDSETTVVSVGYRLAPEHCYPTQLDDCEAAFSHFLSVAEEDFGVDVRRVAVGGDGTGANMAAALCQRLLGSEAGDLPPPCAQLLICPALQMADFNLPSYQQNQAVPLLFRGRVAFYFLQYLGGDAELCPELLEGNHVPGELRPRFRAWLSPDNLPGQSLARGFSEVPPPEYDAEVYHAVRAGLEAEVSPLLAEDALIRKTPPTFLLTCEYDVLRDDGILYRKRLLEAGRDVTWRHVSDGFHGIISFFDQGWLSFPSAARVIDDIIDYVKTL